MMDKTRYVGIAEIAELAEVSSAVVSNWRRRYKDFPIPAAEWKMGPLFWRASIESWLAKRR